MKQRPRTLYRKLVDLDSGHAPGEPQDNPAEMRIRIIGVLAVGRDIQDLLNHVVGRIGAHGLQRHAVEFCGNAVAKMAVDARFRLCKAAIDQGAVAAVIAPDQRLPEPMLVMRPGAGVGGSHELVVEGRQWRSDFGAPFERDIVVDARGAGNARDAWRR